MPHSFSFSYFCISRKRFVVGSISVPHWLHTLHVVFRGAEHKKSYVNFIRYIPYFFVSFSRHTTSCVFISGTCSVGRKICCSSFVDVCVCVCRRTTSAPYHAGHVSYTSQLTSRAAILFSLGLQFGLARFLLHLQYAGKRSSRLFWNCERVPHRWAKCQRISRPIHLEALSLSCVTDNTFVVLDEIS